MYRPRQCLRLLLGAMLYYSGAFRYLLGRKARRREVCVLGFHRILKDEQKVHSNSQGVIVLEQSAFEEVLDFLARRFAFTSLEDLVKGRGGDNSRPRCVITFDDGWRDNYTVGYPALKKRGVPASIFLVTSMIGGHMTFWVERLRAACTDSETLVLVCKKIATAFNKTPSQVTLDDAIELMKHMPAQARQNLLAQCLPASSSPYDHDQMLTWEQVREMSQGGIEFGSHTDTHPLLTYEKDEAVGRELRLSRQKIEEMVDTKVRAFAYPNGDWNERVRDQIRQTGYECAFTTRSGWYSPAGDAYTAPRILLHDGNVTGVSGTFSPASFSLTLMGWR